MVANFRVQGYDDAGAAQLYKVATADVSGVHHAKQLMEYDNGSGLPILVSPANPLPVLFANSSLAITGSVSATQSGTYTVQPSNTANTTPWLFSIHDGTTKATVRSLTNSKPLNVAIVDGSGDQITSFIVSAGDVAHDAADSGNPQKIGGKARNANPTPVANGDRVDAFFDLRGKQIISANAPRELVDNQVTTITSSTSETTIVTAGGANVYNDLTSLTITNKSGTGTLGTLKDATSGTTRGIYYIAAGGGVTIPFITPKKQSTANANWTLTLGTSVDSVYVVAEFIKNS